MSQEEHIISSSHSGSAGGDSTGGGGVSSDKSKSVKQKKVPQRGLGVAQLEKIRLEEQKKKVSLEAANILANNAVDSVNDSVQYPSFGQSLSPSLNLVPNPQSPSNFPSPNTLYRSASSTAIQITNQLNGDISSPKNGNWSRLWNSEYNLGGQRQMNDYLAFRPQSNLPFESNALVAPFPGLPPRSYPFQQPSSPVVNAASGISPSVLSSQIEPPSNQIVHGSNCAQSWPEEHRMVGTKRSYPFSLESLPARSFPGNFDHMPAASRSGSDDLPSCSSGYTSQIEQRNKYIGDGPSNPNPLSEQNPGEVIRDYCKISGDILTLAPPTAALPALNSEHKHPLDCSGPEWPALPHFKSFPCQENLSSHIHQLGPSGSREEPFSFFPIRSEINQTAPHVINGNEEKGETIDLNLKL